MSGTGFEMDFPNDPSVGQKYTNSADVTYEWNGYAWVIGYTDITDDTFSSLGSILMQIRVLLQDTDLPNLGIYRYSDESIIANVNMGLLEMFRLRPDIFLEVGFVVPMLDAAALDVTWPIERQWIPPIVYYAAGLTQMRDDEGTQDTRAAALVSRFTQTIMAIG